MLRNIKLEISDLDENDRNVESDGTTRSVDDPVMVLGGSTCVSAL